ncbi:MAG TPA: ferritin family protein [Vicinamibacteria bacterium]|nr:ferritin family protein [Vicinamibacteria bacterium]
MSEAPAHPSKADLERYRNNYLLEMDGAALYRALAHEEDDEKRKRVLERLAEAEERHARRWAELLRSSGVAPPAHSLGVRTRILSFLAGLVGSKRVSSSRHWAPSKRRGALRDATGGERASGWRSAVTGASWGRSPHARSLLTAFWSESAAIEEAQGEAFGPRYSG